MKDFIQWNSSVTSIFRLLNKAHSKGGDKNHQLRFILCSYKMALIDSLDQVDVVLARRPAWFALLQFACPALWKRWVIIKGPSVSHGILPRLCGGGRLNLRRGNVFSFLWIPGSARPIRVFLAGPRLCDMWWLLWGQSWLQLLIIPVVQAEWPLQWRDTDLLIMLIQIYSFLLSVKLGNIKYI